eukprot:TRINITY_DN15597_c0_g1_i1.p1 TRINITY_DN15597_c0_g1~~TRINITY_DN15597_c0_g1_i1.p1  ORF type:complete len:109 (-),score=0.01 TRINITY_DN15597_c0_g1_i1:185-511(-)
MITISKTSYSHRAGKNCKHSTIYLDIAYAVITGRCTREIMNSFNVKTNNGTQKEGKCPLSNTTQRQSLLICPSPCIHFIQREGGNEVLQYNRHGKWKRNPAPETTELN